MAVGRAAEFPILLSSGQRGKSQLTYQNYRNWRRRIAEYRKDNGASAAGDLLALCTSYQRGSVYRSDGGIPAYGDPQFWRDFNAAYLNQNCLKLTTARDVAAFALRRRTPGAVPPSVAQCRAYVKRMPKELIVAGRMGEVAWRNSICDYISRDWDGTMPGELLIGDSRIFDTRVRVEQPDGSFRAVRPAIVCLLDARSWMPAAWTITVDGVDSSVIMRTLLQYIVEQEGRAPSMCYFDNGKDYCKQGFSTPLVCGKYEHSIFKELGITLVNAQPFNARAKTVERFFRDMMQQFDKVFPDYLGSNPMERPDAAAYFDKPEHASELPSLDAFTKIFREWVAGYLAKPKFGGIHRGQSPQEIWNGPRAAGRVVTPLELAFAFLLPEGLRKVLRGPAVTFGGRRYFCDAVRVGDEVLIKSNPFDPEMLLLCTPDGGAVGIARTRMAVKAIAGDDACQQARLHDLMARQRRQARLIRDKLAEVTGGRHGISVIEFLLALGTDHRFVHHGSIRTIKGKSHTFKRIAPDENVFDPPALIEGNKPVTPPELPAPDAAPPTVAAVDPDKVRRLAQLLKNNRPDNF